ncbi:MAG: cysteine-rich CWC family protein [Gammaproteobacteria bacterium]
MPVPDPHRCPLCGEANLCAVASGVGNCWCFSLEIPDEVLERIPEEARQRACVCQPCASGRRDSNSPLVRMRQILRNRG